MRSSSQPLPTTTAVRGIVLLAAIALTAPAVAPSDGDVICEERSLRTAPDHPESATSRRSMSGFAPVWARRTRSGFTSSHL